MNKNFTVTTSNGLTYKFLNTDGAIEDLDVEFENYKKAQSFDVVLKSDDGAEWELTTCSGIKINDALPTSSTEKDYYWVDTSKFSYETYLVTPDTKLSSAKDVPLYVVPLCHYLGIIKAQAI